jgi:hypothetical protein
MSLFEVYGTTWGLHLFQNVDQHMFKTGTPCGSLDNINMHTVPSSVSYNAE